MFFKCKNFFIPFICNMRTLRKIYLYREPESKSLPEDGWFQRCILCCTITNHQVHFETQHDGDKIYEIISYLCKPCQMAKEKKPEIAARYKRVCERYIRKQYFTYT